MSGYGKWLQRKNKMKCCHHRQRAESRSPGTQMYLYRIDTNDETMQKVIAQLKQDGSVKVEKDGETLSYSGTLFEDYLLLHDPGADVHVFVETMNHYSGGGVTSNAMRESSTTE